MIQRTKASPPARKAQPATPILQGVILPSRNRPRGAASGRRQSGAAFTAIGFALFALLPSPALAVDMPPSGSPFYMQTSGPTAGIGIGDYYTSSTGANGYHYYTITVPCTWPSGTPVMIDIFSPELHGGPGTLDEIRDGAGANSTLIANAGNTIFDLYPPGTAIGGSPPNNTPAGAGGRTTTVTYAPTNAAEAWVRFYTIPAPMCGQPYVLRVETPGGVSLSTNDDNGWRLRVSADDDANPATTPPVGLDTGILVGQQYGTFQQNSGAVACLSFYEYETPGSITMHNFDMDGNTSVTYVPPDGSASTAGTLSNNGLWNNSASTTRVGDTLTVTTATQGWWRTDVCLTDTNQFIWEGATARPQYTSLPLDLTLAKTDGVTTAQPGGYLVYTITASNPSLTAGSNVVIKDTIPTNTTYDSCSVNSPFTGTCSFASGVITYTITGSVAAAVSGTVTASVLVDDPAAGATVTNNATLDYTDSNGLIYPREFASDVDQLPSLKMVKTSVNPDDTGDGPQNNDVITYTLTISNPSATTQTSVVVNDPLPAGTTYVANSTLATGFSQTKTFADAFNTNNVYTGSTGTDAWAGPWLEVNEADGAGAGSERVTNNALRVGDGDVAAGEGVTRQANLAISGGTSCAATLAFDFRQIGLDANETVAVAISGNGGTSFTTLETFTNASPAVFTARSYNVTVQIAANTVVRFFSNGNLDAGEYLEIDNVALTNTCRVSKDNVAGGANPDLLSGVPATLVQAGDGLSIAPGASITVIFQVTVTAAGPIVNTATATSAQDPDPALGYVRDVALTRASIAGLRVGGGVIEFATSGQRGTAGFNLYSANSPQRRAPKVRINGEFIKSPRPESMTPILYRLEADTAAPYLWIEEVELGDDAGRMMGPFASDDEALRRRFERIEAHMSGQPSDERRGSRSLRPPHQARGHVAKAPRRGPARAAAAGVKVEIAQPGIIQLSWNDLVAEGMPQRFTRDPARLQLTTRGDRVPFTTSATGLTFTARDLATDYTGDNVYVVTWAGAPIMVAPLTQSEPPAPAGYQRVQKNWIYYQAAPRGTDPWLWDVLASGDTWPASYDPTQGDFDLPGYAPAGGSIPVRIALLGRTLGRHHVEASINGFFVGSLDFSGVNVASLEGSIAASSLLPSGNRLTLTYTSPDGPDAYVYLNYLDLGLVLPAAPGVIDRIAAFDGGLPRVSRADYLIVTHADFQAQADRIAALKNAAGRSAVVVDVERAYDRFTAGIPDASAVKALIAEARRASTVLLIGDDTIDPADNYSLGARVYVPSALGFDPFTGRVVSENLYADRDDDGAPDLAIGRLSVSTAAEADAMVQKIENADNLLRANLGRHLIAVDNQGVNDMPFRSEGRRIESMLDGSVAFADISLGASAAREALLEGLNAGALTTTYVGHGAPDHWADEGIFGSDDAPALAHTNQGTLLLTWACISSDYRYFYGPAVSEAMVLTPMGGAVASFGPTGLSLPTLQRELYLRLYPKLLSGMTLGEAVRETKTEMLTTHPGEREFLHGWVLLGDPDVRLPR